MMIQIQRPQILIFYKRRHQNTHQLNFFSKHELDYICGNQNKINPKGLY